MFIKLYSRSRAIICPIPKDQSKCIYYMILLFTGDKSINVVIIIVVYLINNHLSHYYLFTSVTSGCLIKLYADQDTTMSHPRVRHSSCIRLLLWFVSIGSSKTLGRKLSRRLLKAVIF